MKFSPHRFVQALLTMALIGAVSACGQKGKLVQPMRPPAISTPYPTAQPKPEKPDGDSTIEANPDASNAVPDSKADNK